MWTYQKWLRLEQSHRRYVTIFHDLVENLG